MTKEVAVHFASGREVLGAYWGYLSGGGLTIHRDEQTRELYEGQPVALRVHVASQDGVAVQGKVVRTQAHKAMIAFDRAESQHRLLTAALSGRYIDSDARVIVTDMASGTTTATGRVFELSEEGCCIRLSAESDGSSLPVGTGVILELDSLRVDGCVVWAQDDQRWLIFGPEASASEAVRAYLDAR